MKSLAERFAVAPPTVREALRRLQANGVVELRHGSGVYVRSGREKIVLPNPTYDGALDERAVLELLDARLLIEPYLAGLAAQWVDKQVLDRMERQLREAEQYLDGSDDHALQRVNMRFHREVAEASGNALLSQIVGLLVDLYSAEQLAIQMIYGDRTRDHREHLEILAAIRRRESGKARKRMFEHLWGVRNVIRTKLAVEGTESSVNGS